MFKRFKKQPKLPMRSARPDHEDYIFMGLQGLIIVGGFYFVFQYNLGMVPIIGIIILLFALPLLVSLRLADKDVKLGRELAIQLVKESLPSDLKDGNFIGKDFHRVDAFLIPSIASIKTEKIDSKEDVSTKYLYYLDAYDVVIEVVGNYIVNITAYSL